MFKKVCTTLLGLLLISLMFGNIALAQVADTTATEEEVQIPDKDVLALAIFVKGDAVVMSPGSEWEPLTFGTVLHDSDMVKTGDNGFMAFAFVDDGSQFKVRPKTEFSLFANRNSDNSFRKRVVMTIGEIFSDVAKPKGSLQVSTPTSVASIKGTEFWTTINTDGVTTVYTTEGIVGLRNRISRTDMDVPEGHFCTSDYSGDMVVAEITPETDMPGWEVEETPTAPEGEPQGEGDQGTPEEDQEPEAETEEPGSAPSGGGGGGAGLNMNGAAGASVIDGETYQFFSLRPDISLGKWGVGLDLSFYFDAEGNLREEDWDSGADVIDKIYYVRYGKENDPLYVRVGAIENITLGYGLIMRRYSNAIEWPQVRRVGMHSKVKRGPFAVEMMVNNFRELESPGVIAARGTYELDKLKLPIVFGATIAMDGNQYLGAKDDDDDGIPNPFDQFPEKNDDDMITFLNTQDPGTIQALIDAGLLADIFNRPPSFDDLEGDVGMFGVDIGIPLIRKEKMNLWVYSQAAQIVDYGMGMTIPGVMFNMGPFRASAEYRIFDSEFQAEFFNLGYEIERVSLIDDQVADTMYYETKSSRLAGLSSASGYYIDAGVTISNLVDVYAAYQNMSYDAENDSTATPNKSLFAKASVNTEMVPKLGLAEAYYHQPRAEDVFDTESDGTTLGYRVGFEASANMMLVFDRKTIYRNGEATKMMTIETVIMF